MQYTLKNGVFWLLIYVILALIPMILAVIGEIPEYRTFWIEFGVALGFIGLSLFALQFIFSGRIRKIAPKFGNDNLINFHRQIGITAFSLILAHPATLIIADPGFISYFDPRVNLLRALALSFVTIAIILITVTSIWRITFKLSYEYWRLLHGFLALAIVFIGVVHAMQVSHYMEPLWKKIGLGTVMSAAMYMVIHTRVVRPWMIAKKPYTITNVKEEIGGCYTLSLKSEGHPRMEFTPGQFAWITIGSSPFSLQQNPFTFASSARSDEIKFTSQTDGDFTSTWENIQTGTQAWLEGPYGSFTPVEDHHLFLIMGGIGVTTAISMLRTMRDDNDPRKAVLIYANPSSEEIAFRDELEELSNEIDLKVVHVLEETPEDWEGEEGFVTEELLSKHMPDNPGSYIFYICGPAPMMDMTGIALYDLGIQWNHIYMERFQIV